MQDCINRLIFQRKNQFPSFFEVSIQPPEETQPPEEPSPHSTTQLKPCRLQSLIKLLVAATSCSSSNCCSLFQLQRKYLSSLLLFCSSFKANTCRRCCSSAPASKQIPVVAAALLLQLQSQSLNNDYCSRPSPDQSTQLTQKGI